MNLRILRSVITGTAMLALVAPQIARASEPIEIPVMLPMTGGAAFLGKEYAASLKVFEDNVNKAGGIKGRSLRFAVLDNQTSPQVDIQLANAAIAKHPIVIIDGGPLALCQAVLPFVLNGPLLNCLSPSLRPKADSFSFVCLPSSTNFLAAAMEYFRGRGIKKLAVINATDATGQDGDAIIQELIKEPKFVNAGMSLVATEHFNLTDLTVAAQVSRIKSSGAEALISWVTGTAFATVIHGVADAGLSIPVVTSPGNMSADQLNSYKSFIPKELLFPGAPALAPEQLTDAAVKGKVAEFRSAIQAAGLRADLLLATPWDDAQLIVDGLRKIGPDASSQKLRDYISGVRNWVGIWGRYDFQAIPNRGIGITGVVMSRWEPERETWVAVAKPGGEPLK